MTVMHFTVLVLFVFAAQAFPSDDYVTQIVIEEPQKVVYVGESFSINCTGVISVFNNSKWEWRSAGESNWTLLDAEGSDDLLNITTSQQLVNSSMYTFSVLHRENISLQHSGDYRCYDKTFSSTVSVNVTDSSPSVSLMPANETLNRTLTPEEVVLREFEKHLKEHHDGVSPEIIAAISVGVLLMLALLGFVLFLAIFFHRRKKQGPNTMAYLTKLLEGNIDLFDPNVALNSQAELLTYNSKWEIPEDSLFFENQLGSGEFGRVFKARAIGLMPPSTAETEVAVKMVKNRTDEGELYALVGELKVLVHLGPHLNIVNLLGAVTKNTTKANLMVVVEYCRNGNLKDFLVNNRNCFYDELNSDGNMKPPVRKSARTKVDGEAPIDAIEKHTNKPGEKRSTVIKTSDLIEWSFQIAAGMNYLTKKKVIHGDLAARNVLLADDNIVKIADFGLSRKTYADPWYYKKGVEALPIKWMAIESLRDRVFSCKSDVWSFGVTLWELFSLGEEPYSSETHPNKLLELLQSGYRLPKPNNAPNAIYDLMTTCWKSDPQERRHFVRYERAIGDMLDPEVLAQYTKTYYDRFGYISLDISECNKTGDISAEPTPKLRHGYLQVERSHALCKTFSAMSQQEVTAL